MNTSDNSGTGRDPESKYATASVDSPVRKGLLLTLPSLALAAVLGFVQPAPAIEAASGQGVYAGLVDLDNSVRLPPQDQVDDAYSALTSYARQIAAEVPPPARAENAGSFGLQSDDRAYSALRDFAQRLGTVRPEPARSQTKLASDDSILDMLQDRFKQDPAPQDSPRRAPPSSPPVDAHIVGAKVCLTCHATQAEAFEKTLMGKIGKTQPGKFDCENCHGPGSAHVKAGGGRGVGGITSFRPEDQSRTAEENNAVCLTCHQKGNRTLWSGSAHETRGLMCTSCHTVMQSVSRKAQLKTEFEPDTCFQCHKNKRAEMWRTSHMPVREGKIVCSTCHNPHGSYSESLLKTATINDTCYKCHAEKRGPFLWEHAPVRESCVNCHDPHGSINDALLKISRPRLCQQCHTVADHGGNPTSKTAIYALNRSCSNCHVKIHGSNSPAGSQLVR
jgi:DmsE family decaheme c-type cytochrome